ncbi:MAG: GNAT family N-acetyltransferase [Acholeplasmatales bacterium]|jgi:diamine N-acetyltransferase|nr:GNAT family N-acetyltransferase [Acholeplasmatales bacterium]
MDKLKTENLENIIKKYQKDYDFYGNLSVFEKDSKIISSASGYINKETNLKYTNSTKFIVKKHSDFFVNILLLIACDKKMINLEDTLDKYLVSLTHASKIKVIDLLRDSMGLADYNGHLEKEIRKNESYLLLSDYQKIDEDTNLDLAYYTYEQALDFYNSNPLIHLPGALDDASENHQIIGVKVIETVYGKNYWDLVREYILNPLKITVKLDDLNLVRYKNVFNNNKVKITFREEQFFVALDIDSIFKIYYSLKKGVLISKKLFSLMKKDVNDTSINFVFSGLSFCDVFKSFFFKIFDYKNSDLIVIFAYTYLGKYKTYNTEVTTFDDIINEITPFVFSYNNPKLVKLNKKNVYDLLRIKNKESLLWFIGDSKYVLSYQYVMSNITCYLLFDNNTAVGTVTLTIDHKASIYLIEYVLVDYRYQGNGYGKALIKKSLEIFKKNKCKTVVIWVDRQNTIAIKTYLSCGFEVRSSFPNVFEMSLDLEKEYKND